MSGLSSLHVLIVDDNAQMRTIVGSVLAAVGIRDLHYAPNGRDGLDKLAALSIDIVFVDYEMPVMNGLDFILAARALAGERKYVPIIMLTGHSDLLRLNLARDRGVTEFLSKPVSARTILQRLHAVIDHPRDFIRTPHYFGPDRRRRAAPHYAGPRRRRTDVQAMIEL